MKGGHNQILCRSLEWFERSYRLLDLNDGANQANYHRYVILIRPGGVGKSEVNLYHFRVMSRCYLQLKQFEQALKHANEAKIRDSSMATQFMLFLIYLNIPDDNKGSSLRCHSGSSF